MVTPIKHHVCKEDFFCNPCICFCECDKVYDIGEYCQKFISMRKLFDNLVLTCY